MKFTKLSLVAALLAGTATFAIDNVKVSGDAKLYYTTSDANNVDLFNKAGAAGQAAASLALSADLVENVSAGTKVTALSTLGLEGQLVNNVWEGTNGTNDSYIVNELWIAGTVGKTTGKIGRMELDTPYVFSEKWSIVANTFEAAVVINQDIPDTTLVGAYVGGSNGQTVGKNDSNTAVGIADVVQNVNNETTFDQFYKGAYAIGAINNSFKPLTVQAWYFDAATDNNVSGTVHLHGVQAYWLQADLACQKIPGLLAGVQYTGETFQTDNGTTRTDIKTNAWAAMLGYEMKDVATIKVAYSDIDKDHAAGANLGATGQSKLYTEAFWGGNFNKVTQADTQSYKVSVESPVNGLFDLTASYTNANNKATANNDMTEIAVAVSKSYGPADITLAYINSDVKTATVGDDETSNRVNAYLTLNF